MTSSGKSSGTLRTTYEDSFARLDSFPAIESNWRELLPRLLAASTEIRYRMEEGREGTLDDLLEDYVLTVLIVLVDIARKETSTDTGCLQNKINKWITQLDRYIDKNWKVGNGNTSAVQFARQLKNSLEESLPDKNTVQDNKEKQSYYRMLRTVRDIQEHFDYYLAQIENSGNMDGALSLLIVYLRNYGGIAQTFNRRFATLTELYHHEILHARPQTTVQDNAYIVITPAENIAGFTLPAGEQFSAGQNAAGEDLLYHTTQKEYITPMQRAEVNVVYLIRGEDEKVTGICKQPLSFGEADITQKLFADEYSQSLPLGWQVESSMLVLNEGERNVSIRFCLTADSAVPDYLSADSFTLQFSNAEGWTEPVHPQSANLRRPADSTESAGPLARIYFDFTIGQDAAAPVPCNQEIHGLTTVYPVLRILSGEASCPYEWASRLKFNAVEIQTKVTGIRNFTFNNDLGAVDTSQPFPPFGIQAERGAWFLFGSEEMGLKPLQEVCLKGIWKKLPDTKSEFDKIYKECGSDADSFLIKAEWLKDGKWYNCGDEQKLFSFNEANQFNPAELVIRTDHRRSSLFRVTLNAPAIGFGMDAYRKLYTDTMINNSRCKKKDRKALPLEPVSPSMADAELSYIAFDTTLADGKEPSSIFLSRITALPEPEAFSIRNKKEYPFFPIMPSDNTLYFSFLHAQGERTIRMYLDMVLPPSKKLPDRQPTAKEIELAWEYWNGKSWQPLSSDSIHAEETLGLTQSGFIEIKLSEKINGNYIDKQGRVWLRAFLTGDVASCLAIRNIWTNCIRLTATNSDGTPLPAATIQSLMEVDERIESIAQPLTGFGGRPAEVKDAMAVHQTSRIRNRHRAITPQDYEQLVLEHFPEVDKVQCVTPASQEVRLIVFSRLEDDRYYLSPAWKLAEIERLVKQYTSPFVSLQVVNPAYKVITVKCKAVLWRQLDEGKTLRQLVVLAQNYIEPWYRKGEIPTTGQHFSYKELHARMANHEDLMKLVSLEVDGKSLPYVDIDIPDIIIQSDDPTDVLIPKITIELLSPKDGINQAEIENNFIIM